MFKNLDKYQKKCWKKVGKTWKKLKKSRQKFKNVIISWKTFQ